MNFLAHRFQAMGSPCEILIDTSEAEEARACFMLAEAEARRIETQYSRYRQGNIIDRLNKAGGEPVEVDDETAALLDYADRCYALSGGLFDVTTGALRRAWTFDGSAQTVSRPALRAARACVGWKRVSWKKPRLQMPAGFELDLGGVCKEYAADRILQLLRQKTTRSVLVNLGGDIAADGQRLWSVGIEDASHPDRTRQTIGLRRGSIATSGTTHRFSRVRGRRLGHILHPRSGWPVREAPLSVTVAAATCTEAGLYSTLAMLHGNNAEGFLSSLGLEFWCSR